MTLRILRPKVQKKHVSSSISELERGYRLAAVKEDQEGHDDYKSMLQRLKRLAHTRDSHKLSVNQTNLDSAEISRIKVSHAINIMNIQSEMDIAIREGTLLSTLKQASNILRFKTS